MQDRELTRVESEALEAMIDGASLPRVLYVLACIASEKADHVMANYQDEPLAKAWEQAAQRISTVANSVAREGL